MVECPNEKKSPTPKGFFPLPTSTALCHQLLRCDRHQMHGAIQMNKQERQRRHKPMRLSSQLVRDTGDWSCNKRRAPNQLHGAGVLCLRLQRARESRRVQI